jgi:uncharacterized protein (DUF2252 family)
MLTTDAVRLRAGIGLGGQRLRRARHLDRGVMSTSSSAANLPDFRPSVVEHPSVEERAAGGRSARKATPRSKHADFAPPVRRSDPIALLESQATTRVQQLVPIRYGRMLVSPFTFYRGAALVMANDLATTPTTDLRVQLCGDAHLSNFGIFGTPERRLVFDINDFDETSPGPFEWDIKRLAASLEIAGRDRGFTALEREAAVRASVASYRTAMAEFAGQTNLEVYYASLDVDRALEAYRPRVTKAMMARTERTIAKARTRDSMHALNKMTEIVDGEPRIKPDPPLVVRAESFMSEEFAARFADWVHENLRAYRNTLETDRRRLLEGYRFVDLAQKVVGVGSVGTRAWMALLLGRDNSDPLFLQFKEAQASVLEAFCGASAYRNHAHRVVAGQRLMQAAGDILLGWMRIPGIDGIERDFYVRQLRDWKGSAEIDEMIPEGVKNYAELCGWTLARAHANSGDRIAIAAYLGRSDVFDRAIVAFATKYADQNERDHAALVAAVDGGRIIAETGV